MKLQITQWNADAIVAKADAALVRVGQQWQLESERQMATVKYPWKWSTPRFVSLLMGGTPESDGGVRVDPGLRDIVDTGEMADRLLQEVQGGKLSLTWNVPYSGLVLKGGYYGEYVNPKGQLVKMGEERPGRDWITPTLQKLPPLQTFADAWRSLT